MTEQKFRSEMRRAEAMRKTAEPEMSEYWAGYIRGLRRAYHGENFGTQEEHALWLSCVDSPDEMRKQRGQGYRDGLAFAEISSAIGRPPVGDETLPAITVPAELLTALKNKSVETGLSMPDARREAYRLFTKK